MKLCTRHAIECLRGNLNEVLFVAVIEAVRIVAFVMFVNGKSSCLVVYIYDCDIRRRLQGR
jgi:hypothetical protein